MPGDNVAVVLTAVAADHADVIVLSDMVVRDDGLAIPPGGAAARAAFADDGDDGALEAGGESAGRIINGRRGWRCF